MIVERRKVLGRINKDYIKAFTSQILKVQEADMNGYAALIQIQEVHWPFIAGETCLYDNGHSEINFLPNGACWQLSALYDANGDIIEWYFDITKKNAVDEVGNPYCDDLYLDAALMPDGQILILDEDELKDALDSGQITQREFAMAYAVLDELKEKKILSVPYMEAFCARLRLLFQNECAPGQRRARLRAGKTVL